MTKVFFYDIEKSIINLLGEANISIDIAVSWFTNRNIYNKLLECCKSGIKVRLVILNDKTNNHIEGINFQSLIDNNGELFVCNGPNLMHHKYCILDSKTVATGSCNWTNNLDLNDENLIVIEDSNITSEFTDNFKQVLTNNIPLKTFIKDKNYRSIENSFLPVKENQMLEKNNNLDKVSILRVEYVSEEKGFIVLNFWSKKISPFGRIGDPHYENKRTRFLSLPASEIKKIKIGDFIPFPAEETVSESSYIDSSGKKQKARWIIKPKLSSSSFFSGTKFT